MSHLWVPRLPGLFTLQSHRLLSPSAGEFPDGSSYAVIASPQGQCWLKEPANILVSPKPQEADFAPALSRSPWAHPVQILLEGNLVPSHSHTAPNSIQVKAFLLPICRLARALCTPSGTLSVECAGARPQRLHLSRNAFGTRSRRGQRESLQPWTERDSQIVSSP